MQAVVFGLSPIWVAGLIFLATYLVIVTERVNRAIVSLLAAGLMVISGVLTQEAAIHGVDFNTLGLLLGMMLIVSITRKSGLFQYVAIWSAKRVRANPWGVLVMLFLITALFSALLDNVTTVMLIVPIAMLITDELGVNPYPYFFSIIFASNIGGTATLIGDPPNIMIGSAAHLSFNDFLYHLAPVILVILAATMLPLYFVWRKKMATTQEAKARVMGFRERESITDSGLMKKALFVLALVVIGFVLHQRLHLAPATIAIFGAAALLLLESFGTDLERQNHNVHHAFAEIEWITIFFFIGLFIVVKGVEQAGMIKIMADALIGATRSNPALLAPLILWGSAISSAFVDNIPFVATMIPLIKSLAPALGGDDAVRPLWWALALGACLGGNGTLVGASANLVVAGMAEKAGTPIRFVAFFRMAFPLMLLSILISHAYLYLRYL